MGLNGNGNAIANTKAIINNSERTINKVNVIKNGVTETVWQLIKESVIFNNGITRQSDSFKPFKLYDYNTGDCGSGIVNNQMTGWGYTPNYDRVAYAGGMLTLPLNLEGYSRLCVQVTDSFVDNPSVCSYAAGLYNECSEYATGAMTEEITGGAKVLTLDLAQYKSIYGNVGYFIYYAGKTGFNEGSNTASYINISKVWLE